MGRENERAERNASVGARDSKLAKLSRHRARYRHLWELASAVMVWAVPSSSAAAAIGGSQPGTPPLTSSCLTSSSSVDATRAWTETGASSSWSWDGLAVSHNFVGSPHIDTHDVSEQFALSLGDFGSEDGGGGELCVESAPMEVTRVNTHGRLAKVGKQDRTADRLQVFTVFLFASPPLPFISSYFIRVLVCFPFKKSHGILPPLSSVSSWSWSGRAHLALRSTAGIVTG